MFFIFGLIVISRPAPKLKINVWLTSVYVRHILRRYRKRVLRRIVERDHATPGSGVDDEVQKQYVTLLDENKIETLVELRRVASAAHAAALAAAAVGASTGGVGAAVATALEHAAAHVGDQALSTASDHATAAAADILGTPDIDGSLANDGVRRNSLILEGIMASGAVGDASCVTLCLRSFVNKTRSGVTSLASQVMTSGQMKILVANLQINASLTVVFAIPWPPIHTRFINFLSVFKLDLFTGLAIVAPCIYSSHFMSLAGFVAAPLIIVAVFVLAFIVVAATRSVLKRLPRSVRHGARRLPCCRFTLESAGTSTIKLAIGVILFLYPTICSKVFMTFKCVEVGGKSFLVADMSKVCFEGEWIFAATVAAAAIAVYVVGIPLFLLLLLFVGKRRGTLAFPEIEFAQHVVIKPVDVMSAASRMDEFFRNRTAYGSLYDQVRRLLVSTR